MRASIPMSLVVFFAAPLAGISILRFVLDASLAIVPAIGEMTGGMVEIALCTFPRQDHVPRPAGSRDDSEAPATRASVADSCSASSGNARACIAIAMSAAVLLLAGWPVASAAWADGSVGGIVSYPGGSPGAGVEVYISPSPPPVGVYMTKEALTDSSGHWTYNSLTPGTYTAIFVVSDIGLHETQATQSFTVREGEQASLTTNLSGPPRPGEGTLAGTVTNSLGIPAGGAQVMLTSSGGWTPPSAWVDENGSFRAVLVAGTYGIVIRREDPGTSSRYQPLGHLEQVAVGR